MLFYTHLNSKNWKTQVVTIAGKDVEQQEDSYTAGGSVSWWSHSGKQWALHYKGENIHTLWLGYSTPRGTRVPAAEDVIKMLVKALFVISKK